MCFTMLHLESNIPGEMLGLLEPCASFFLSTTFSMVQEQSIRIDTSIITAMIPRAGQSGRRGAGRDRVVRGEE